MTVGPGRLSVDFWADFWSFSQYSLEICFLWVSAFDILMVLVCAQTGGGCLVV